MPVAHEGRFLASGVHSEVYLTRHGGDLAVVKVVHAPRDGDDPTLRPHNIAREARLLRRLPHENIVRMFEYTFSASEHRLTLQALPLSLGDVFAGLPPAQDAREAVFVHVARSVFAALEFLHAHSVAHRDIKPGNILISEEGVVKLIDLATAWDSSDGDDKGDDGKGGMVCQVGTGPYRAPELLFGAEAYDAPAIDLWAAGVTLAQFYKPGIPSSPSSPDSLGSENDFDPLEDGPPVALGGALFDASFGEIGLAASIFRVMGTPSAESWPSFSSLPDAHKVAFEPREPKPLGDVLDAPEAVVRVLEGVLRLEPARRTPAAVVLRDLPHTNIAREGVSAVTEWAKERKRELEESL